MQREHSMFGDRGKSFEKGAELEGEEQGIYVHIVEEMLDVEWGCVVCRGSLCARLCICILI